MIRFAEWFAKRRELVGFPTQKAFADACNASAKTIQTIEAGDDFARRQPTIQDSVARELKISRKVLLRFAREITDDAMDYLALHPLKVDPPDEQPEIIDASVIRTLARREGEKHFESLLLLTPSKMFEALVIGWVKLSKEDADAIVKAVASGTSGKKM